MDDLLAKPELDEEENAWHTVIFEQLEGISTLLMNLKSEVLGLFVMDNIEQEIVKSKTVTANWNKEWMLPPVHLLQDGAQSPCFSFVNCCGLHIKAKAPKSKPS